MKVSEIFYSLQGEGARAGEASIFIRLQGCSAKHACFASGVRCDTEFESGAGISNEELLQRINRIAPSQARWIIWTGGEPTDQLTEEDVQFFKKHEFKQAIETSGIRVPPRGIDFVSLSPKFAEHVLAKTFMLPEREGIQNTYHVEELRYVRHVGQEIPKPSLTAVHYFLSPHFDGASINEANLNHCIQLCLENPRWKLSVQTHKLLRVL